MTPGASERVNALKDVSEQLVGLLDGLRASSGSGADVIKGYEAGIVAARAIGMVMRMYRKRSILH